MLHLNEQGLNPRPSSATAGENSGIRSPGPWRDIDRPNQAFRQLLVHRLTIGWGDCDPAQIAYTANIPAWSLQAIEAWYRHCVGLGWYELNLQHGIGTPFVSLGFDFKSPVTPYHPLDVAVKVSRLGNASLSHHVEATQNDVLCFTGNTTAVFVEAESMRPRPVPDNIRASIERYITMQVED